MTRASNEKVSNYTRFGEETEFLGTLVFTDTIEIAGKFEGTIQATGNLEIAKTAVCKADTIAVHSVNIEGVVSGDITAEESVEIRSGSTVAGNITTKKLRIEDDVDFEGEVTMLEDTSDVNIFDYSLSELRDVLVAKQNGKSPHEQRE